MNYSFCYGSPFQNRNSRMRKGKKNSNGNEKPGMAQVRKIQTGDLQLGKLRRNMKKVCKTTDVLEKENT